MGNSHHVLRHFRSPGQQILNCTTLPMIGQYSLPLFIGLITSEIGKGQGKAGHSNLGKKNGVLSPQFQMLPPGLRLRLPTTHQHGTLFIPDVSSSALRTILLCIWSVVHAINNAMWTISLVDFNFLSDDLYYYFNRNCPRSLVSTKSQTALVFCNSLLTQVCFLSCFY